jgi:hypothetical protein
MPERSIVAVGAQQLLVCALPAMWPPVSAPGDPCALMVGWCAIAITLLPAIGVGLLDRFASISLSSAEVASSSTRIGAS